MQVKPQNPPEVTELMFNGEKQQIPDHTCNGLFRIYDSHPEVLLFYSRVLLNIFLWISFFTDKAKTRCITFFLLIYISDSLKLRRQQIQPAFQNYTEVNLVS